MQLDLQAAPQQPKQQIFVYLRWRKIFKNIQSIQYFSKIYK